MQGADDPPRVDDCAPMQRVSDAVWVGSMAAAQDADALAAAGITHALSVGAGRVAERLPGGCVSIADMECSDLLSLLPTCLSTIRTAVEAGGSILVHCVHGQSRSVAVVAAWLMVSERMAYSEALERIKRVRPCLFVNAGFVLQLQLFGRMGHALRGQSAAHALAFGDQPPQPAAAAVYCCRKCRRPLFHEANVLAHCAPVSTAACSVGVFVEPLAWMDLRPAWQRLPSQRPAAELPPPTAELDAWAAGTRLADEVGAIPEAAAQGFWPTDGPREGKLVCPVPACAQKLGAWSVERASCGCGTRAPVGAVIVASRVDRLASSSAVRARIVSRK